MAKAEGAFPKKKLKVERVAVRDQMARAWVGWPSPGRWRVQVSELVPGAYTRVCMVGSIIVDREWVCPVVVNGRSSHVVCPAAGPVTCLLRRVRLAAPGHVARASGVLWTGRGMDGVQGGRCGMSGARSPAIRVWWPLTTGAPGPRPRFDFAPAPLGHRLTPGLRRRLASRAAVGPSLARHCPPGPSVSGSRRNVGVGPGASRRAANRRRRARGVGSVSPSPPGPSRVSPGGKRGVACPSLGG